MISTGKVSGNEAPLFSDTEKEEPHEPLSLERLRTLFTKMINQARREGNPEKELALADQYVEALVKRYEEAAKAHDYQTMDQAARFLWDGIPGCFKCAQVIQNRKTGKLEASCGKVKEEPREAPTQCDLTAYAYFDKVNRVRTLMGKVYTQRIKYQEERDRIEEYLLDQNSLQEGEVEQLESWRMMQELITGMEELPLVEQEKLKAKLDQLENDEDKYGATKDLFLTCIDIQLRQSRRQTMGSDEMVETIIELTAAYKELQLAQSAYQRDCAFAGENNIYMLDNAILFEIKLIEGQEDPGGPMTPIGLRIGFYNAEGGHIDSFYY